jgi:hypothetical protein
MPEKVTYSVDEIIEFLKDLAGTDDIYPTSDIFEDVGMGGDDFHEMIEKYARQFSVNMDNYLWYFHADEEGFGSLIFKPPYMRVNRIPVTPQMLANFANRGKWELEYPDHKLPKHRYDLWINTILAIALSLILILAGIFKLISWLK